MLDIILQLSDSSLELVRSLHTLLPRFSRRHGIAGSLDGSGVLGIDVDRGEGFVATLGADAGGSSEAVAATAVAGA